MKKICLIIPSLRHGGAERVISVLANEWVKNPNCEVNLLLLTKQDHFYNIDSRVNIIEPQKLYTKNSISKLFYTIWVFWFIRNKIYKLNPTSVLSFCERYNNIVLLALLGIKIPIFVSDRNNPSNNLGLIHEYLRKKLYKKAKGIIAQTETAKTILFNKTGNLNIKAIPNPLRGIKDHNDIIKENIIMNVGRFELQKNQKELIEIFSQLELKKDWKLRIIGVGSLKSDLEETIREKKLEDQVELLDFQKNIDEYFQQAKIFAFTSIYEGFPNALSEAMANGLASIAYDCPTGPSELIQHNENGYLIPLHNKEEYIKQLQLLVDDENLRQRISMNAKNVKTKFSSQTISNEYLNFITT
ncbi:glycosyltransferase family 4 protein [Empedobacter falsenii]